MRLFLVLFLVSYFSYSQDDKRKLVWEENFNTTTPMKLLGISNWVMDAQIYVVGEIMKPNCIQIKITN